MNREDFDAYADYYDSDDPEPLKQKIYGELANKIPKLYNPPTTGIAVELAPKPGYRPLLRILDETHQLYLEQSASISIRRIHEFLSLIYGVHCEAS